MTARLRPAALLVLVAAALFEVGMRVPAFGGWVLQQQALATINQAGPQSRMRTLDRLVDLRGAPADHTLRGLVRAHDGSLDPAGRDLLIGVLADDAGDREIAHHALSGLHLLRAGIQGPVDGPGPTPAGNPDAARTTGPRAAFIAARNALRLDPLNQGARWNLYLSLQAGGAVTPPEPRPRVDNSPSQALRDFLQRSVRAVEASTIRQSLPSILRAMEERVPQTPRTGPPW